MGDYLEASLGLDLYASLVGYEETIEKNSQNNSSLCDSLVQLVAEMSASIWRFENPELLN